MIVEQFNQFCYNFDINNHTCISPDLEDYKKKRTRSRLLELTICETYLNKRSILDVAVVDWIDNGSSYACLSRANYSSAVADKVFLNIVVGQLI